MSEANGIFEVHCSGAVAKSLRDLQLEAPMSERKRIARAFRIIVRQLRVNPRHVGEPLYRLPQLRLQVRIVAIAFYSFAL